jgi:hypothetical protein
MFRAFPCARLKGLVEQPLPTPRVQAGGVRYHTVKIKKDGAMPTAPDDLLAFELRHGSLPRYGEDQRLLAPWNESPRG